MRDLETERIRDNLSEENKVSLLSLQRSMKH